MLMTIARGRLRSRAASITRRVTASMPALALMTTATVSTAGMHESAPPINSGAPGTSMRLMRLPE